MNAPVESFETRIDNVARRHPGSPKRQIVLTRLYFLAFQALHECQNRHLNQFGINTSTWIALMLIYSTPENAINPGDLSCAMVSSKTNVTRLSDELVAKGWVNRSPSPGDRRKILLSLTPRGIEFVETILPRQMAFHRSLWQDFTESELDQFEATLRKLLYTARNMGSGA